jgi:hypothetical protein
MDREIAISDIANVESLFMMFCDRASSKPIAANVSRNNAMARRTNIDKFHVKARH